MEIEEMKKSVLAYVEKQYPNGPLIFSHIYANDEEYIKRKLTIREDNYLRDVVIETLNVSETRDSLTFDTKVRETPPNRWRSVFDLWRHIIYYNPEVTIFQVMRVLFTLEVSNSIIGQFCTDVNRRVFHNKTRYAFMVVDKEHHDEFGLQFKDWGLFEE